MGNRGSWKAADSFRTHADVHCLCQCEIPDYDTWRLHFTDIIHVLLQDQTSHKAFWSDLPRQHHKLVARGLEIVGIFPLQVYNNFFEFWVHGKHGRTAMPLTIWKWTKMAWKVCKISAYFTKMVRRICTLRTPYFQLFWGRIPTTLVTTCHSLTQTRALNRHLKRVELISTQHITGHLGDAMVRPLWRLMRTNGLTSNCVRQKICTSDIFHIHQ